MLDMPYLGIRFDIDKVEAKHDTGAYGSACYRHVFEAVPAQLLNGCALFMGDSRASLNGEENVCVIGLQTRNGEQLQAIERALRADAEFSNVAAATPLVFSASGSSEPLGLDGVMGADGVRVEGGGFSWAKAAYDSYLKDRPQTEPVTVPPVAEAVPVTASAVSRAVPSQAYSMPAPAKVAPVIPAAVRTPALIAGVAAILAGFFSYLLGLSRTPTPNWFKKFTALHFHSLNAHIGADMALFIITALLLATVGVTALFVWRHLGKARIGAALGGAFGLYALLLLISGIAFRQIYITLMANRRLGLALYRDLPVWLLVIVMIACFVALVRLFGRMNTAGRVFAVLAMIGAASVVLVMVIEYLSRASLMTTAGTWFSSPAVTYILFGCVLLSLAAMRPEAQAETSVNLR